MSASHPAAMSSPLLAAAVSDDCIVPVHAEEESAAPEGVPAMVVHEQAAPVSAASAAAAAGSASAADVSVSTVCRIRLRLVDHSADGRGKLSLPTPLPAALRSILTAEEYAVVEGAVTTAEMYAVSDETLSALRLLACLWLMSVTAFVFGIGFMGQLGQYPPSSATFIGLLVSLLLLIVLGAYGMAKLQASTLKFISIDNQIWRVKQELERVDTVMNRAERMRQRHADGLSAPHTQWTMARDHVAEQVEARGQEILARYSLVVEVTEEQQREGQRSVDTANLEANIAPPAAV